MQNRYFLLLFLFFLCFFTLSACTTAEKILKTQDGIKDEESYESTVTDLVQIVNKDNNFLVKAYAMQVLSRIVLIHSRARINHELVQFFIKMLDNEESLAGWAAKGLGNLGKEKAIEPLLKTIQIHEPGELTFFCLESLAKLMPFIKNDPQLSLRTFEVLMGHLPKCNTSPQNKALTLLIRKTLSNLDNLLLGIQSISAQKNTDSLYSNLIMLGDEMNKILSQEKKIDEYQLINILNFYTQKLNYNDREVKLLILWYLGNFKNPVITDSLIKILKNENDFVVLYAAAWTLFNLNNPTARNMLSAIEKKEHSHSTAWIETLKDQFKNLPKFTDITISEQENILFNIDRLIRTLEKK